MKRTGSKGTLSEEEYERCLQIAADYVAQHQSIRNCQLREAAGVSYDQAIRFFNRAIEAHSLVRKGKGSRTHYVGGAAR